MNNRVLQLDPRDNVLIALSNLSKGETITFDGESYVLGSDVRAKHKFATRVFRDGRERHYVWRGGGKSCRADPAR